MPVMPVPIEMDRLMGELQALAAITAAEPPVVTRVVFSEADLRARAWFKTRCDEAGLVVREDAVGNTFARWQGTDPTLAAVATGSHIDAIPNAGAYDGTVGVLGGLEAIRALQRGGYQPRRSVELILFTSEEPTRFGIGCLGSRLMSGVMSTRQAETLRNREGNSLNELRAAAGFAGELDSVLQTAGCYAAFVELHIEQGPLLERDGLDLGVVTAIAAPASMRVTIEGEGGHAGAMLMADRHDALTAASELTLHLEHTARSTGAIDTVATVGVCEVFPGAVNSVPSRVRLEADVRDIDGQRRDRVLAEWQAYAAMVASRRGVRIGFELVNADPPASCDDAIVAAAEASAAECGLRTQRMVSRAYHDSLFMARLAPVAMLFIPCRGGVSHRPDEFASPAWIEGGVKALALTLKKLSQ